MSWITKLLTRSDQALIEQAELESKIADNYSIIDELTKDYPMQDPATQNQTSASPFPPIKIAQGAPVSLDNAKENYAANNKPMTLKQIEKTLEKLAPLHSQSVLCIDLQTKVDLFISVRDRLEDIRIQVITQLTNLNVNIDTLQIALQSLQEDKADNEPEAKKAPAKKPAGKASPTKKAS